MQNGYKAITDKLCLRSEAELFLCLLNSVLLKFGVEHIQYLTMSMLRDAAESKCNIHSDDLLFEFVHLAVVDLRLLEQYYEYFPPGSDPEDEMASSFELSLRDYQEILVEDQFFNPANGELDPDYKNRLYVFYTPTENLISLVKAHKNEPW